MENSANIVHARVDIHVFLNITPFVPDQESAEFAKRINLPHANNLRNAQVNGVPVFPDNVKTARVDVIVAVAQQTAFDAIRILIVPPNIVISRQASDFVKILV